MQQMSLSGLWEFRQANREEWLPAEVPGSVQTDLMAAGKVPDPFVFDNELLVMWVAESDWVYRRRFDVDLALLEADQVHLVCDGINTFAALTLNGSPVGSAENMFRQYRWDVKPLLKSTGNELVLSFDSTVKYITAKQSQREMAGVSQAIPGGPHSRTAPCQFGWDWGPQLPPMGIWKDIRLEAYNQARLEDVHLRQRHEDRTAVITADVAVDAWRTGPLFVRMEVERPIDSFIGMEVEVQDGKALLDIAVEQPDMWWPNGYGAQPLYDIYITLSDGQHILDRWDYQLGLRTLELRQEPDQWGKSFTFIVNGVPIFAKGSNWIPADSFPNRITSDHLYHLLKSAADSHQNMVRVWGGGFYEDEVFYDLCDRLGILVWQDFIFSCSTYPLDEDTFLENVHQEVIDNVRRLRHRASLALWCGNNEMEWGTEAWSNFRLDEFEVLQNAYDRFFHHLLPEWVSELDPDRSYWPSSPSSGTPFENVNGQEQGDAHYWEVWHGRLPFSAYRTVYPRFMSEFGFQSLPPMETIKTYAQEQDWNLTSYIMEHHQRNAKGNGLMIGQMSDLFRMPRDFQSLVYLTMVLQAEGIRYGVEHWRRHMDRVKGTLYWQLNDTWPVASWSSIDYFGRWKALHYAARRFYAPVLLSLREEGTLVDVHISSDQTSAWEGRVLWSLVTLDGLVIEQGQEPISVDPLSDKKIVTLNFPLTPEERREAVLLAELYQGEQRLSIAIATFAPNKHLKLIDPRLNVNAGISGETIEISVSAQSLARFVEVSLTGVDTVFSDNYFDIPAGWTITVSCPLPEGWSLEQVQGAVAARSLYDSY
jgi:beta-mannosidase